MKTISTIFFTVLWICLIGCASAAPLPPAPKTQPFTVGFTNQSAQPLLAGNRMFMLPPMASDFTNGLQSTNWVYGTITAPTNQLTWPNPPPGAQFTVSATDPQGNEAVAQVTVTNNNQVIVAPIPKNP